MSPPRQSPLDIINARFSPEGHVQAPVHNIKTGKTVRWDDLTQTYIDVFTGRPVPDSEVHSQVYVEHMDARDPVSFAPVGRERLLPEDSAERKTYPMAEGLLDYFPDALAAVANVSFEGNKKHNPGQPTHWSRGKSNDHADCILRHLATRGTRDAAGIRHSANLAWRALALLQEEIEKELGLPLSRGSR